MLWMWILRLMLFASLGIASRRYESLWNLIPKGLHLLFTLALFLVELVVFAIIVYIAGLLVVGKRRARFYEAFIISFIGIVLSTVFFLFLPYPFLSLILSILVWLLLIKSLYETGWFGAIAVGILAVALYLVVLILLAFLLGILHILTDILLP